MRGLAGRTLAAAVIACAALLAGCSSTPHNDVLIFGTDTKLALDISASATDGGTPEVTVGYKRKEAVWMPLMANARGLPGAPLKPMCMKAGKMVKCGTESPALPSACFDEANGVAKECPPGNTASRTLCKGDDGVVVDCTYDLTNRKYVATAETKDGKAVGTDSYSVFASFGANIQGSGDKGAKVGLAQFFATGIAAQRLAANSQVANALSVQPEGTGKAMAAATAAEAGVSPEVQAAIAMGKDVDLPADVKDAKVLTACAQVYASNSVTLDTLVAPTPVNPGVAALYPGFKTRLAKQSSEKDFIAFVARERRKFDAEIDGLIVKCGGKPA